jgi:hypothetical protein
MRRKRKESLLKKDLPGDNIAPPDNEGKGVIFPQEALMSRSSKTRQDDSITFIDRMLCSSEAKGGNR